MPKLGYLERLESESLYIFREVVAECERPVLLYSVGKDSSVMLHLARKAFAPARPPFPLLHIASGWDFSELLAFRDAAAREAGLQLLVHTNEEGVAAGVTPFTHGAAYSDIMLTQSLRQALDRYGFDAAFGGGRRDEEKSRAKERVFSFRSAQHR
jgi:sulfate adenylyltransferase subunit 2